ncbi:MAG TPA: peptide-methionine (R)-S-oxide reductase, partial [Blastocatellia bacterium]|nr:peptide-methionine (R)-S-oxide reductase [Blastocatellia bacterium]
MFKSIGLFVVSILAIGLVSLPFLSRAYSGKSGAAPGPAMDSSVDGQSKDKSGKTRAGDDKIVKTLDEWRNELTPEQFYITREAGTETAYTGQYWNFHGKGTYVCVCCGYELF